MNTPNPNPSPELREAAKRALRYWHRDSCYPDPSDGELDDVITAIVAALSPQTLPAPGEEAKLRVRLIAAEHAASKWEQACQQSWDREALATVAAANDEGVARIIDPYAWCCYDATLRPFQENRGAHEGESWHVRAYQAGCRSADDASRWWRETANDVEPYTVQQFRDSLAKAAAIRLLSQGEGK